MTKENGRWLLTEDDIRFAPDDMLVEVDDGIANVQVYLETWFDVDLRFGTKIYGTDDYINLYAIYEPYTGDMKLIYFIHYADGAVSGELTPNYFDEREKDIILKFMYKNGLQKDLDEIGFDRVTGHCLV